MLEYYIYKRDWLVFVECWIASREGTRRDSNYYILIDINYILLYFIPKDYQCSKWSTMACHKVHFKMHFVPSWRLNWLPWYKPSKPAT